VASLDSDDLRFSPAETESLLRDTYHLPLENGVLALVEQRLLSAEQRSDAQATRLDALDGTLAQAVAADSRAQARQAELLARVEVLETQATGDQPYGDAIRLVRQGAREARLVDELGLSPIEAALIVRLHGACAAH
jgi:uncharacterized coiled-coil protein SlyX